MRSRRWAVPVALSLALVCSPVSGAHASPARGPSVPDCAGPKTTDTSGLVGDAHPVILVHGWIGNTMDTLRTNLEHSTAKSGFQYLLYDYTDLSTSSRCPDRPTGTGARTLPGRRQLASLRR